MGLFGAIASAASEFRILPSGPQGLPDAGSRPPLADPGPATATPATPAPAPTPAPTPPVLRPLTGALGAQVSDIAARQSAAEVRDSYLQDIGTLFGSNAGTPGLSGHFDAFAKAWQHLAANPSDPAGQQEVVNQGSSLALTVRSLSQGVEGLAGRLNDAVTAGLNDLNQTLSDIHQANRVIVSQNALNRPTDLAEAHRDQLVTKVVDLTGANVFPRENKTIALFTPNGQALLDQRPTRFTRTGPATAASGTTTSAASGTAAGAAVPADGRIDSGRLGALLRLTADGSRQTPPQRVNPDPGTEIIRKLRSQLDAVAGIVLGRSRANQPTSFADAYDSTPATADGQLPHGFFIGSNRQSLQVNPTLLAGTVTLKTNAAPAVATSLAAERRQIPADGLPAPATSYAGLVGNVSATWNRVSGAAAREARVADAANTLMTSQTQESRAIDLQAEMTKLQTLQSALGSTHQIGHSLGAFMAALGQRAAAPGPAAGSTAIAR
jgi:flagellar hook-associated protein 1 FlgK